MKKTRHKGDSTWQEETERFGKQLNEQIAAIEATLRRIQEEVN